MLKVQYKFITEQQKLQSQNHSSSSTVEKLNSEIDEQSNELSQVTHAVKNDVKNWLSSFGFQNYYPKFKELGYDDLHLIAAGLSKFLENGNLIYSDDNEMKELGIVKPGHQKKLALKIAELKSLLSRDLQNS